MSELRQQVGDIAVILATNATFFAFGWVFFHVKLFKDYEIQGKLPAVLFSATFALSCSMFELVIFEILGYMAPEYVVAFPFELASAVISVSTCFFVSGVELSSIISLSLQF